MNNNKHNRSGSIPIPKSNKSVSNRNVSGKDDKITEYVEMVSETTGCTKMEAYITLENTCMDPIEAVKKLKLT